ncbi:MAG: domain-TPR-repeat-containing protein [Bacteroidetes bacterium]|nr:domain-TPR-repeat-containing protein [Bacteroidota bacterium]
MPARLFSKTGQLAGATYEIQEEATIGKSVENSIQLYPGPISGRHARIFFDKKADAYFLEDLRSRNGTRVDGIRVRGKERLSNLSIITLANTFDFIFQILDAASPVRAPQLPIQQPKPTAQSKPDSKTQVGVDFVPPPLIPQTPPPKETPKVDVGKTVVGGGFLPLPKVDQAKPDAGQKTVVSNDVFMPPNLSQPKAAAQTAGAGVFVLEFKEIKGRPMSFTLKEGENILGRAETCQVAIEDASLSRNHAVITVRGDKVIVKDLGSKNHTFVDNKKIVGDVEVQAGTGIIFGLLEATLMKK